MPQMTIHLLKPEEMIKFYGTSTKEEKINLAHELMSQEKYTALKPIEINEIGEKGAEIAFDLTNNPARDKERATKYGHHRSVSVGDIVEIDNEMFLCESCGWLDVTAHKAAAKSKPRP